MEDVVIVSAARTPVGAFNGAFATVPAHKLGEVAIRSALERAKVTADEVSEVILGQVLTAAQGALADVALLERPLLQAARAEVETVHVAEALSGYVLDLARASREHAQLTLGLSTRGALAMLRAARIVAALRGAEFVSPDDVKEAAQWVMAHRLVLTPEAALEGTTETGIVAQLLAETPVPR